MGKSSQRKGRAGELELCKLLQNYGYQTDPGRADSYGTQPDITGLPGVHIEVKRVEKLNVPAAFAQAKRDSEKFRDGVPAVFHRRNREPWLVTMSLEDWLEMYGKSYRSGGKKRGGVHNGHPLILSISHNATTATPL